MKHFVASKIVCVVSLLFGSALVAAQSIPAQPEAATGRSEKTLAHAQHYMVAAAHPQAVEAGLRMLEAGGSAVDAAIATQLVLNLVEPQSSGIGGGAFLMYYDAKRQQVKALDGREVAPASATPTMFLDAEGRPLKFYDAAIGGKSIGVPGVLRMLELAHKRYGKLKWAELFAPAIALAEQGFVLTARPSALAGQDKYLRDNPNARRYFFDEQGQAKAPGTVIKNPEFAAVLRQVAERGADAFYKGEIAQDIVAAVNHARPTPGQMSLADLADYTPREVQPVCGSYKRYRICGMPPSSSGGVALLQMLQMLSLHDMERVRPMSGEAVHWMSEVARLAYADRGKYLADDRFVSVPVEGLLNSEYLRQRAQRIQPEKSMGRAEPGVPPGVKTAHANSRFEEATGTSHISIVDAEGNALSMTTTIEDAWGSRQMVRGFMLNNQLTDFSFLPDEKGVPVANNIAPGKRPRSSMSPTLVFDADGKLLMTLGSPGGSQIINYVLKTLIATLDWKMDMQSAIALPNFGSRNGPTELEKDTAVSELEATLKSMGHEVRVMELTSGIQGIVRTPKGLEGGADPRREGVAKGR